MRQFFLPAGSLEKNSATITGENYKHLVKVLRLHKGDKILLADGSGKQCEAEIKEINSENVLVEILREKEKSPEPPVNVTLLQGLPKKDKMELIIQKGTELGMHALVPIECARATLKLDSKRAVSRKSRWQKIALEASKQCQRALIPEIGEICSLKEALNALAADLILFLWEDENTVTLKESLHNISTDKIKTVAVAIGPEGGWAPEEVQLAHEYNAEVVSLGPRILRTETAGIAVITMLLYQLGDLGG